MNCMDGRFLYKEAFGTETIYVFDEDFKNHENVHALFLKNTAAVYESDMSMNAAISSAKFIRSYYEPTLHRFKHETYKKARYYWRDGDLFRIICDGDELEVHEFIYMHFQMRKMRYKTNFNGYAIDILPDRFKMVDRIPERKKDMRLYSIGLPYLYWWDVYIKKARRKLFKLAGL